MSFVDLKVVRSTAPVNGRTVTVYRPVKPIHRLFVTARANGDWTICHDIPAAKELLVWAALAAQSADSVVWIPKSGDKTNWRREGCEPCDLLLCHHSLQLRAADWKSARVYARKGGAEQTLSVLVPDKDDERSQRRTEEYRHLWRRRRPEPGTDLADFALHSNTVFLVGSRDLFEGLSETFQFQLQGVRTGDHDHLFHRARECYYEDWSDLTVVFYEPRDWVDSRQEPWMEGA